MSGVYIHIPFCKSRCRYCDFYSTTALQQRQAYTEAIRQEAEARVAEMDGVRTVYMGGGTPSLLEVADIERLLSAVKADRAEEVTLEANPGDLDKDNLNHLRNIGINRLSIGIQSFSDTNLKLLGRRHTAEEAVNAVKMAQEAGFSNLSIDLMYALPQSRQEEDLKRWQHDLETAFSLGIQHLSCYCLSYENGTRMTQMLEEGKLKETDEDTANRMYDTLCDEAYRNGFEHYEISNFSLPGKQSLHNSNYWNHTPYVGLGAGAHSYDGKHIRRANINNIEQYIASPTTTYTTEYLTDTDIYNEKIMLSLRTAKGIDFNELPPAQSHKAQEYISRRLLKRDNNRLSATREGIHILNLIIEDLMI